MWWILGLSLWVVIGTIYNIKKSRRRKIEASLEALSNFKFNDHVGYIPDAEIFYEDVDGNTTKRKITIISISETAEGTLLKCHCFKRNDLRSFYVHRIKEYIDFTSGQIIDNLPKYISESFENKKIS